MIRKTKEKKIGLFKKKNDVFSDDNINRIGENQLTLKEIEEISKKMGADLSEDYKNWLLQYNGVMFKEAPTFLIPYFKKRFKLDNLYALSDESAAHKGVYQMWWYNQNYQLDANCLVIGEAPYHGDGYSTIVILKDDNEYFNGIFALDLFYDEPYFDESSEEEGNVYKIADNFTDFVKNLH